MKIAVALSGYFNTISTNDLSTGARTVLRLRDLFKDHDVDYYIHSWDEKFESEICDSYEPKKYIIEPQIDFNEVALKNGISQEWFDENFDRKNSLYSRATIHNSLSFLYSRSQALKLIKKDDYEWVCVMRLDLGHRGPDDVNFPHKFDFSSDNSKIYSPFWNQLNCGLGDMWTITNTQVAREIENIYDRALKYYKPNSSYVEAMTKGWPLSEKCEFNEYEPKQFSNICLSKRKTKLMTYPRWYAINGHSIYKYFFIEAELFEKITFCKYLL